MTTDYFEEALYSASSIPEAIDIYSGYLRSTGDIKNLIHANKLQDYKELISPNITLKLRTAFDGVYNMLSKESPELRFRIAGRRKSFISLEQKIRKSIAENKSLDLIRDMLGTRIILLNGADDDCFRAMESMLKFCIKSGYTICEENMDNEIPEYIKTMYPVISEFYYGITDYISYPKENGYRSLHAVFVNNIGKFFEVQIRTFSMHVDAAFGNASHCLYKQEKYEVIELDRTRINMPGYFFPTPQGCALDLIGLEHSIELLQRNKTF